MIVYLKNRLFSKKMSCFLRPHRMQQILFTSILLSVLIFGAIDSTYTNSTNLELDLRWKDGNTLPPDSTSVLNITVTNLLESSFNLVFVGVRFDWMQEGIYVCLAGPSFETPADLRFLKAIGVDAVGMSTVPEVTTARHGDMRVLGLSTISNKANLDGNTITSHEEVLEAGQIVVPRLTRIVKGVLNWM